MHLKFIPILCSYLLAISFIACDKIENPIEQLNTNTPSDTTLQGDFTSYSDTSHTIRKLLLEDFTGHTCGNCPAAAAIAQQLKETYQDTLITVGVHSGYFSQPESHSNGSYSYDFRTPAGNAYNTLWGNDIAGNPNGFISRSDTNNNNLIIQPNAWASVVQKLKDLAPKIKLEVGLNYNSTSRILNTTVKAKALNNLSGNYKLVIYVVEDSIVSWQKDYSFPAGQQNRSNYVHRHVLRDVINGTWGEELINGNLSAGTAVVKSYSNYTVNADWDASKCEIIAYLYNTADYEIIQCDEVELVH